MNSAGNSLILIGMPGAGKSTIGILLAKLLAKDFVDTDLLIQLQQNNTLQNIVDNEGYLKLREIEEDVLLNTYYSNHIIATGGSAVYSDKSMAHLKQFGEVVFLDVPLPDLIARVKNIDTRGLARRPGQTFSELYNERYALYQKYADIKVDCGGKDQDEIVEDIISAFAALPEPKMY
jgi:shikimate kinase